MQIEYKQQTTYEIDLLGLKRELPIIKINDQLWIASFVMLGDVDLVNHCAKLLSERIKSIDFDYLIGPEAKVLPLLHAISTSLELQHYIVCRKDVKAYMQNPLICEVKSITTKGKQTLVMDNIDVQKVKGKKVLIVDDVVSTGGTFLALEKIVEMAGATVIGSVAVLKEGDSYEKDAIYLQDLPIFVK